MNRSPDRDSHSRFGKSREPPSTSRSWWKHRQTGQPCTAESAASSQSAVASVVSSVASTIAVAWVAEATAVTSTGRPPMRKRTPACPVLNTGAEATSVTLPLVPDGASVTAAGAKRWKGSCRNTQGATVQLVWLVRVMRCGGMSGWHSSSVSALWVKASCGSIAAVQGPATCATWPSSTNTAMAPAVSTSR